MNRDSVDCEKIKSDLFEDPEDCKPGRYCFDDEESHLYIFLPYQSGNDGGPHAIPITRDPAKAKTSNRIWLLSGTQERPTLSPSINAVGSWHGWLRDGRLVSC